MAPLSIVIPTLGETSALATVIAGLARQLPPLTEAEVVVVVDARGPSPSDVDTSAWPLHVQVLKASRAGASAARNLGWRTATSPLVLFLDDDIVPVQQLVAEHLDWHARYPETEVGVLGRVHWSPQVRVTPFMRWLDRGIQFDYATMTGPDVGWQRFYSCNVSVKREMLARVDGFDERRFPFGYEDLELARRMSEHGFRLMYNPAALGEHLKTETLESWRRNVPRIAQAERRYTELYPAEYPYFYERFRIAAQAVPARGRSARLARYVPPGFPWLGKFVWRSFDLVCSQRLASEFMAAWNAADPAEQG